MTLQLTAWERERERKRERECEGNCSGWGVPISFLSLIYFSLLSKFLVSFKLLIIKVEVALLIIGDCLSIDWSDATRRLRKNENKKKNKFYFANAKVLTRLVSNTPYPFPTSYTHTHTYVGNTCVKDVAPSLHQHLLKWRRHLPFHSQVCVCVSVLRFALDIRHACTCVLVCTQQFLLFRLMLSHTNKINSYHYKCIYSHTQKIECVSVCVIICLFIEKQWRANENYC